MPMRIAYIVSRFPHLPETFILREMICLEKLGWDIELYPLIYQKQKIIHDEAVPWLDRAHRLPWLSGEIIRVNFREFLYRPGFYLSLWMQILRENIRSPKFLIRAMLLFPKAVLMAKMFRDDNIKHIHAHYATHPALVAWIIHQLTGISYSVTVHAHDIFVDKSMLATKMCKSTKIVAISEYNRDYLARFLGDWVREKTQVIHCGIEPDWYAPLISRRGVNNVFEIISIGSLQLYKGQKYLVQACALLRDRGVSFRCRMVGGGSLYSELSQMIETLDLKGKVELLGPKKQEDVAPILSGADCYIQPSVITSSGKMEGIPVALMEAMASELPVVASSLSGIPELVIDGKTGWLVPPGDPMALANAIEDVYNNPSEAATRAIQGRKVVLSDFTLTSNVAELSLMFSKFA